MRLGSKVAREGSGRSLCQNGSNVQGLGFVYLTG